MVVPANGGAVKGEVRVYVIWVVSSAGVIAVVVEVGSGCGLPGSRVVGCLQLLIEGLAWVVVWEFMGGFGSPCPGF